MIILSKDEVIKEMGVVPWELTHDFYIKRIVSDKERVYSPIESLTCLKLSNEQN